jgi:acyl-CoA reductase-like NAD-dependent aldehyde dehydrogenase
MSTQTIESRSPQDQSDVVVSAPAADREAVAAAFKRAREAQRDWRRNAVARADALSAAAAALDAANDQAQSALDPDGDTIPAAPPADMRTLLMSRRRPRGVAGLITPWNFPFAIPLWKAAPALAYGNAVVLKPSTDALACALLLEEILKPHLPEGLFNVVSGEGETGQAVIEQADVVSFTGSTKVGLQVAQTATARGIASQAEMGGLNASIVLPDADLEAAAKTIAGAAMGYAGQKCTATGRVLVLGDTAEFTDALAAAVDALPIGDPKDERTIVGPVINAPARAKLVGAAAGAPGDGGRVVTGGQALDGPGLLFAPTVVDGQDPTARLAQEEVFGPIVTVLRAGSAEEAVEISNSVPYGLVTSVFTCDLDNALTVVEGLETGMIRINMPTSGVDFHAPFGGEKQSSFGPREQGKAARELYTTTHTITIGPAG